MDLTIRLLSDATFSSGLGTAGEVDIEVDHDRYGLPLLGGKALHGLLRDSWLTLAPSFPELHGAMERVFGAEGSLDESCILRIEDACLPEDVQDWARYACEREDNPLTPGEILRSLTYVRRQTAQARDTGAPKKETLRSTRVLLHTVESGNHPPRSLELRALLAWSSAPDDADLRCLALSALGLRHSGHGRNRGRGFVEVTVDGDLAYTRILAGLEGGNE